jgi:rare lipoprotein A
MMQIAHPPCVVTSILANLFAFGAIGMVTISPHTAVAGSNGLAHSGSPLRIKPTTKPQLDFSGRTRIGIASFYADRFAGRKMANGVRMNPLSHNAASRTLPLGTIARVTNLKNHKSVVVSIQDRGPYIQGRIVDLSPSTAREIGITREMGIAKVRVTPITIPPRSERIKFANRSDRRCEGGRCDGYKLALEQSSTTLE